MDEKTYSLLVANRKRKQELQEALDNAERFCAYAKDADNPSLSFNVSTFVKLEIDKSIVSPTSIVEIYIEAIKKEIIKLDHIFEEL